MGMGRTWGGDGQDMGWGEEDMGWGWEGHGVGMGRTWGGVDTPYAQAIWCKKALDTILLYTLLECSCLTSTPRWTHLLQPLKQAPLGSSPHVYLQLSGQACTRRE